MKPKTAKTLTAAAIIAAVLTIALILRRPSIPKYEITDLGFCGRSGHVSAINDAGQVTGWSRWRLRPSNGVRLSGIKRPA